MKGSDFVLNLIRTEGISHIFMVPGTLIAPFMSAFERFPEITPIVAAHEAGAAFMADGYARATRKFGVCMAISGAGVINMTTASASALSDSVPVMILSGGIPLEMTGLGVFQDSSSQTIDEIAVFHSLTAMSFTVDSPRQLNHVFRKAMTHLSGFRQKPVHISIAKDVQESETCAVYSGIDSSFYRPRILDMLSAMKFWGFTSGVGGFEGPAARIAILAGGGVERSGAENLLKEFAERFQIPVATTLRAKGVFPDDHPLSLGVFGYAGTRHATEAILSDKLDILLSLGATLNERNTMHWSPRLKPRRAFIDVRISSDEVASLSSDRLFILADISEFLNFILESDAELTRDLEAGVESRRSWLSGLKASFSRFYNEEDMNSAAVPIHSARVIRALRDVLPRETVMLVGSGAHRAFAAHYWESYFPGRYLTATTLAPMGWEIAAAVGAACARPHLPHLVITGDGCMLMHGIEIQTAARYRLPIVYVVINNSAHGNVWIKAHKEGPIPAALTMLPDHDWAGFARALGLQSLTVRHPDELHGAFETALNSGATFLVDVKCDRIYPTPIIPFLESKNTWVFHE